MLPLAPATHRPASPAPALRLAVLTYLENNTVNVGTPMHSLNHGAPAHAAVRCRCTREVPMTVTVTLPRRSSAPGPPPQARSVRGSQRSLEFGAEGVGMAD